MTAVVGEKPTCYCLCNRAVAPVSLVPDAVTQSVRNVWSPPSPLHHRVVRSCLSPGERVIVSDGLLTCVLSKKLRR